MSPFYNMQARSITGEEIRFGHFRGQVVLIVNTASACGFTPQCAGLNELYTTYASQGFTVLGFPCNQFGHQEPGDNQSIQLFCSQHFDIHFPLFEKIDVNGAHASPLYQWLTKSLPGFWGRKVRWNFTKFLLNRSGQPIARYAPNKKPERLCKAIEKALQENC